MLHVAERDARTENRAPADSLEKLRETSALHALTLLHNRNRELFDLRSRIDRYLHINSHDLRGPVVQILGLVSLLREDESLSEEGRQLIELLEHSANELDEIVRNLNDLLAAE